MKKKIKLTEEEKRVRKLEYMREYYRKNKSRFETVYREKSLEYQRKNRKKITDKYREYHRKRQKEQKEKYNAYMRECYKKNKHLMKYQKKKNKQK